MEKGQIPKVQKKKATASKLKYHPNKDGPSLTRITPV